jgi:hypothetical protein
MGSCIALAFLLSAHVIWRSQLATLSSTARGLPTPPSFAIAQVQALGDPVAWSKFSMLWLQAFDTQAGASVALRDLDYGHVIAWLALCLRLDPRAQYPLLAASRLYAEIPDPARARQMLDFVRTAFTEDPARRWPWLAHAVYVARHRLHDKPLALEFARTLAAAAAPEIPHWARQLEIFVLEDLGELEAAKVLLGGLLASGQITDTHEQRLLSERLQALEKAARAAQ